MGNKLKDEDLNLNIIVNGDKGKKELGDLEKSTRDLISKNKELRVEKEKLIRAGKQETAEYKAVTKEITANNKAIKANESRMTELRKEIGITGLTMRQLRTEQTRLKRLMDSSTPGTPQWKTYRAELNKVEAQMGKVRSGSQRMQFSIGKMADGFNRYFSMITVFIASLTGVIFGFKKASNEFAQFDDRVADVRKTTNLTKEEVLGLDKALQKIDTRTAQDDLLGLARIAGKLGITGVKDVEGFVRAADKIRVGLTEDLGGNVEESVRQIGKLTDIFNLKQEFGIEQSIIKVGSAINALGAASTANEEFLVEFTKRVAGIAPSAGISIDKVLGLAATLDQLGQTSEVSSTVYSQLIPNMFKDTDTYARIAGMSVSDFSKLLKQDANEAFIKFLEGLKGNNGGLQEMVTKLDGLGLEGKRTISVLGVLSNNTEKLREQQTYANQQFEKGTSLITEFNLKNNTRQAQLEKSRKNLALITRELGQNLSPAVLVSTNSFTYFVKALVVAIRIFKQYYPIILSSAAAIAAYTIALRFSTAAKRADFLQTKVGIALEQGYAAVKALLTGQIKLATIAQKAWNVAVKDNPIGAILAVVIAVGAAIWQYSKNLDQATAAQKALNDVGLQTKQNTVEQKLRIEQLLKVARDEKRNLSDRLAALKELNQVSPEYFGNLTLEKINTEEAKKATDDYIKSIEQKARVEAAYQQLVELEKKHNEAIASGEAAKVTFWQTAWNSLLSGSNTAAAAALDAETSIKNMTKAEQEYLNTKKALTTIIYQGNKKTIEGPAIGDRKTIGDKVYEWTGKEWKEVQNLDDITDYDTALKTLEQANQDRMNILVIRNEREAWTDKRYKAEQLAAELSYLTMKQALQDQYGKNSLDTQAQIAQKHIELQKSLNAVLAEGDKELFDNIANDKKDVESSIKETNKVIDGSMKKLDDAAKKEKQITDQRNQTYLQFAESVGASFGQVMSDSEATFKDYLRNTLVLALEAFHQFFLIEKAKAIISGAAKGPIGAIEAIGKVVAMEVAYQAVKAVVTKGLGSKKEGGYTGQAASDNQPMGIYHANEWFANSTAVRNPDVKQFLDVFDYYQRTGQVAKIDTKTILASIPLVGQMAGGGYSTPTRTATSSITQNNTTTVSSNPELIKAITNMTKATAMLMKNGVQFPIVPFKRELDQITDLLNQTGMNGFEK